MLPSRYMLVDERSPYPVKRRVRGRKDGKQEPAITLLPPDPYLIMERPNFDRLPSPTMYRTAPPKSAKNKEASSFVILGETIHTPVQSRPGSPSGRVSPFRGHGFKSPNATRPNSRAASPSVSPKKNLSKLNKEKPRISRDIGLPPKSPKSKKPKPLSVSQSQTDKIENSEKVESTEKTEKESREGDFIETQDTEPPKEDVKESSVEKQSEVSEESKPESPKKEIKSESKPKPNLSKKPPTSPTSKTKKPEKLEEKSVIKKAVKPPIPPKKVGMKATLKADETSTAKTETVKVKETQPVKVKETTQPGKVKETTQPGKVKETTQQAKLKEVVQPPKAVETMQTKVNEKKEGEKKEKNKEEEKKEKKKEEKGEVKKKEEEKKEEGKIEEKKEEEKKEQKTEQKKEEQKLIPCFQPDKCQIAPPTMASPSPIITPSISTPSTSADLASSSTKNSQSISAAPTTVTPSSFSSVSSTVVLSGNLARKEIEQRTKSSESRESVVPGKEPEPPPKTSVQTLKSQGKDSVSWSKKDNLSGEITSTTKVIKSEPDMEVLSPNNLRDSPPRAPPPNVAWDDDRLPNGDVPNKAEADGKFRTFISAAWKFLSYLIYCRCFRRFECCRKRLPERGPPLPTEPSWFSKLNCFKGRACPNPFKRCLDRCRSGCCGNSKCCRSKPKPKSKPRKCCAKSKCCSLNGCCDRLKKQCSDCRDKVNTCCRSLFCLNLMCCQRFLRKFTFCHKFKCCQKEGWCSCCNPNVKKDGKKLNKKGSRGSNNSRDKDDLDVVLVEHTSLMKAAIPVLPSCLAVFCLICNLFVPGFGTFISGMLCLCVGKPRFSVKDSRKNRVGSFCMNTVIAIAQLFTVVFCLVGWGWSIWWGVIMYKLSRRQKRLKLAEKNQKEAESSNVNQNHVDVEQG